MPQANLDVSWQAALYMAVQDSRDFGEEIVFTYGPLGFLAVPLLLHAPLAALALVYAAVTHFAASATFYWAARRTFPTLGAFAIAFVVTAAAGFLGTAPWLALGAVAFIWAAEIVGNDSGRGRRATFAGVGGAVAAVQLLVSLYSGLIVLAVAGGAVLVKKVDRWRDTGIFAGTFAATLVVLWLIAGQPLENVASFFSYSLELSSGYSTAMGFTEPGRAWELLAAPAAIAILFFLGRTATRGWDRLPRLAVLALGAGFAFLALKHGFVRHDGHSIGFFATALAAALAFPLPRERRRELLLSLAVLLTAFLGSSRVGVDYFNPLSRAERAIDQARAVANGAAGERAARDGLQQSYALQPRTRELLAGETVHIAPVDAAVAWAYPEIDWRPMPIFQSYVAYTAELDDLNADFLASEDAPKRILRSVGAIDQRHPTFDSPAATVEMLCRYVEIDVSPPWQVLARTEDRCGTPELVASVRARPGELVPVPQTGGGDSLLLVRFEGVGASGVERLLAFAYKLPGRALILDGANFRFVPETASNPHLIDVPAAADYSPSHRLSPEVRWLSVAGAGDFTARFYRMRISGKGVIPADSAGI